MRITSFQIENYKSFRSSAEIHLTPGFNVIVGQNDAGKTALVEAVSLRFGNKPHRSLRTVPTRSTRVNGTSYVHISFEVSRNELTELMVNLSPFDVFVPPSPEHTAQLHEQKFRNALSDQNIIKCVFHSGSHVDSAYHSDYGDYSHRGEMRRFEIDSSNNQPKAASDGTYASSSPSEFATRVAQVLRERIYFFSAERLNIAEAQINTDPTLLSNAANLAQVLNLLQSSNVSRFRRFNEVVRTVFPEIKQITVPPTASNRAQILVWTIDPDSERDDLAMPLSESGTGIGQVLAMLYVILTSEYPRTIVIDEPQSFLHPGAVRKLFDIFRQHPQHQYIMATHSPTVVTAADPQTFYLVRKEEAESTVEQIDIAEMQKLRLYLSEIGARLSDVFGADNILWVEGRTEELCFPMILSRIAKRPLLGTEIIGVVQVGDFEGKHSKTVFEIYTRLSRGRGLLPPAIGFIFDREGRTEGEREDLIRQSRGSVSFTPRRMYENYLLSPCAIASVMSSIEGFRDTPVTAQEVEEWLQHNRWTKKYFETTIDEQDRTDKVWITEVHGGKILQDIFKEFSEHRFTYEKIEYGVALTEWIIENTPEDLEEIADLIQKALAQAKTQ